MEKSKSNGRPRSAPRWTAAKKVEAVLRVLAGESVDAVSRDLKVGASQLSQWKEAFVRGGEANLKSRKPEPVEQEVRTLHAKIGELTMDKAVLQEAIKLRGLDPLVLMKSKK
jgi:transposase